MGSIIRVMSEQAATQDYEPVTAIQPIDGLMSAVPSARKTVSADSFKKLTALLKKSAIIPTISPIVVSQLEPVNVAPVAAPAPIPEIIELAPAPIELAELVVIAEPEPVFAEALVVPTPEPEVVPVVTAAPTPEPAPVVAAAPIQAETLIVAVTPVPTPASIVAVAPVPAVAAVQTQPKKFERPKPRDAFALPHSASIRPKSTPVIEPVVQTPQQEQESAELARSLLDMMASGASSGLPQERALAADTLLRMLPRLPLKALIVLAERLCMMDAPPQLLVAKLICDSRIEIAGPLLEECMHITDEDLLQVILEGTAAKNRMISRRRRLSRAVSAQLVQTREHSVLLTLTRNVNAEIPHESFADLVALSQGQPELQAPLCTRPDLPVPFAFELFWLAPAQLRRYLLSRFLTDSETLTKILKITLETSGDESEKANFPDPELIRQALALATEGKNDEAAAAIAELAKIEPGTAARILSDEQGDALSALLKATGVPRQAAADILQEMTCLIDPTRDKEELKSLFDSLSFNKARILLTYWDWATTKSGPYAHLN
jgi:uncharacterized protein (DUF2336 family)